MVWLQIFNCMLRNTTQCLNTCQIISNQTQNISITFIIDPTSSTLVQDCANVLCSLGLVLCTNVGHTSETLT